jgi:hypothetical protein
MKGGEKIENAKNINSHRVKMTSINEIPPEILRLILLELRLPTRLGTRLVCRDWNYEILQFSPVTVNGVMTRLRHPIDVDWLITDQHQITAPLLFYRVYTKAIRDQNTQIIGLIRSAIEARIDQIDLNWVLIYDALADFPMDWPLVQEIDALAVKNIMAREQTFWAGQYQRNGHFYARIIENLETNSYPCPSLSDLCVLAQQCREGLIRWPNFSMNSPFSPGEFLFIKLHYPVTNSNPELAKIFARSGHTGVVKWLILNYREELLPIGTELLVIAISTLNFSTARLIHRELGIKFNRQQMRVLYTRPHDRDLAKILKFMAKIGLIDDIDYLVWITKSFREQSDEQRLMARPLWDWLKKHHPNLIEQ